MKNKKKIKFFKDKSKSVPLDKGTIEDFLYMVPSDITVRELQEALTLIPEDKKEIWTELDMMEVMLTNDSLVFENMMDTFDAPTDQAFLKEKGIKTVYAFNYNDKDQNAVAGVMKQLYDAFGGFIASDTEDFAPMYEVGDYAAR